MIDAVGFGTADPNPFSPDFGQTPDHLVGRDRLLGSLGTALASGPRSREFTSLLMGPRGSGQDRDADRVGAASRNQRMDHRLSSTPSTAGIADRARQAIVHARDVHEGAEAADPDSGRPGRWSGIRLGPLSLQRAVLAEVRPEWDMRHLLAKLAEHAQKAGVGVLMTLDEVHSGDRNELRRLSADLQHITKRANLPLAVAAAGLSEMKHTLLMDKKMTFFRRCARLDLPDLSTADAMEGLRLSVLDAGGTFDQDALRSAAAACGPLPYGMQLVGYNAWKIAGAPQRPIDILAVEEATRVSTVAVLEDLIEPAWHDLPNTSRSVPDRRGRSQPAGRPPAPCRVPPVQPPGAGRHRAASPGLPLHSGLPRRAAPHRLDAPRRGPGAVTSRAALPQRTLPAICGR